MNVRGLRSGGGGEGGGVGAEVLCIQRDGMIIWGRNANKTAALALKARNVISPKLKQPNPIFLESRASHMQIKDRPIRPKISKSQIANQ